jgi:hypothetical protein
VVRVFRETSFLYRLERPIWAARVIYLTTTSSQREELFGLFLHQLGQFHHARSDETEQQQEAADEQHPGAATHVAERAEGIVDALGNRNAGEDFGDDEREVGQFSRSGESLFINRS